MQYLLCSTCSDAEHGLFSLMRMSQEWCTLTPLLSFRTVSAHKRSGFSGFYWMFLLLLHDIKKKEQKYHHWKLHIWKLYMYYVYIETRTAFFLTEKHVLLNIENVHWHWDSKHYKIHFYRERVKWGKIDLGLTHGKLRGPHSHQRIIFKICFHYFKLSICMCVWHVCICTREHRCP